MISINKTPGFEHYKLDSGAELLRFNSLSRILQCDIDHPRGLGGHDPDYIRTRRQLTKYKKNLMKAARKDMAMDKDFLSLVYKSKTANKGYKPNMHGGNLSMPAYVTNSKELFMKRKPGVKRVTLDIAFQVGTLSGMSYEKGFIKILKTILMAQALNITLNIDMFDSDTKAIAGGDCYTIVRVVSSEKKLNMADILLCSIPQFFASTLFNSYNESKKAYNIGSFLSSDRIEKDLGGMYDVISGNMLTEGDEGKSMAFSMLKIASL